MNPVAAAMVKIPREYPWSSFHYNALGQENTLITPHDIYTSLGISVEEQTYAYRELYQSHLAKEDIHIIRNAAHYCHPTGDNRFKESIEQQIGRRLGYAKRGRPRSETLQSG